MTAQRSASGTSPRETLHLPDRPIEVAQPADIAQLTALAIQSFKEAQLPIGCMRICPDRTFDLVAQQVLMGDSFVRRNKLNPQKIDGAYLMSKSKPGWSDDYALATTLFYIRPEFRKGKLALSLLNAVKNCAIINNLPLVFDLFTTVDVPQKKQLFIRNGFKDVGSSFIYFPQESV